VIRNFSGCTPLFFVIGGFSGCALPNPILAHLPGRPFSF
jgi:hypothetical protein